MNAHTISSICLALVLAALTNAQSRNDRQFSKDGLTFDYSAGWAIQDDSNGSAQQLTLARANANTQIRLFVYKKRITPDGFGEAKKTFIDPYVTSVGKQFVAMGAKPQQANDSTEIAGEKADGVAITANLGGEPGGAKVYWALIGRRVVMLTYFGPDKELKQFASAWDLVRSSLKIENR